MVLHREAVSGEVVWWAEAEAVPGFSAASDDLDRLRKDIGDALADLLGPGVHVKERWAA